MKEHGANVKRVIIADDHELYRAGLRALLASMSELEVVGEVDRGDQVLTQIKLTQPDLIVLDQSMPGANGLDLVEAIQDVGVAIVLLTGIRSEALLAEAIARGVGGVVTKSESPETVRLAIQAVLAGETFWSDLVRSLAAQADRLLSLTLRELQVLRLIGSGARNKDVARRLNIAVKTVDAHRTNLMRKLDVHSVAQLVDYAIKAGMTE